MRQKFSFARQGLRPRDGTGVSNRRRVRVAQSHRAVVAGGAMGARRRRTVPFTDGGGRLGCFGGDARGGALRQGSLWLLQCSLRSSLSGFAFFLAVWTRCGCFCSSPAGATRDGRCCFPARVRLGDRGAGAEGRRVAGRTNGAGTYLETRRSLSSRRRVCNEQQAAFRRHENKRC